MKNIIFSLYCMSLAVFFFFVGWWLWNHFTIGGFDATINQTWYVVLSGGVSMIVWAVLACLDHG